MSVRGPLASRGREHGRGRGRGRGGKSMIWEWDSYTPGPEIYDQLWVIRKTPTTVTPQLPNDCPIPKARTRILDRRQTETAIQRNFYTVEITRLSKDDTYAASGENERSDKREIEEVDLSCILQYVSPRELELFENKQFRIEAEAEAEVLRQDAKELARRRLEKSARVSGTGKGSRMLSGLGLDPEAPTRGRGRPRGRGRGRGRGNWRGRGVMAVHSRLRDEETQHDLEPIESLHREEEVQEEETQRIIAETESEEEDPEEDSRRHASPNLMRSAFVANSALPVLPVIPHRRLSAVSMMQRGHIEVPDIGDSDSDMDDEDARSMSSAAVQLRYENHFRGQTVEESEEERLDEDHHHSKRRRTASTASDRRIPTTQIPSISDPRRIQPRPSHQHKHPKSPSDDSELADPPSACRHPLQKSSLAATENGTIHVETHNKPPSVSQDEDITEEEDSEAEEYAIEAILEHYYDGKTKYYLVKWEGYEDSHDWLPEERLAGAAELVAKYNARIS